MGRRPTSWSYSAWSAWSKCAAAFKYARIDRLGQPSSPAMERGTMIHSKAEQLLLGNITGMPTELKKFSKELLSLKRMGGIPEQAWTVDKNWKPSKWKAKNAWLRAKTDAHLYFEEDAHLVIIDFKTGRIYDDHEKQAEIYSVMGTSFYPDLKTVEVEFWYLDQGSLGDSPFEYNRASLKRLHRQWNNRGVALLSETEYEARPSKFNCKWCAFRKDKGGPCEVFKA